MEFGSQWNWVFMAYAIAFTVRAYVKRGDRGGLSRRERGERVRKVTEVGEARAQNALIRARSRR